LVFLLKALRGDTHFLSSFEELKVDCKANEKTYVQASSNFSFLLRRKLTKALHHGGHRRHRAAAAAAAAASASGWCWALALLDVPHQSAAAAVVVAVGEATISSTK
jgi:hypothetical protein